MSRQYRERLGAIVRDQPAWSDLPVLFLTREGADSPAAHDAVCNLGNVTLLERPLRISTLLSAVQSAVRARKRQYQIRGHLEERERATEALRAADQRKDEFLATLGHELRNPLAPLLTGLQLLAAERPPRIPNRARDGRHGAAGYASRAARRRSARGLAYYPRSDRRSA